MEIRLIFLLVFDVISFYQLVKIVQQNFFITRAHATQVIHHTYSPLIFLRCLHCRGQHFVEMILAARILYFIHKPLHKYTIESIFFHPSKMSINSRLVIRTKGICRASIGKNKLCLILLLIFRYIRPIVY